MNSDLKRRKETLKEHLLGKLHIYMQVVVQVPQRRPPLVVGYFILTTRLVSVQIDRSCGHTRQPTTNVLNFATTRNRRRSMHLYNYVITFGGAAKQSVLNMSLPQQPRNMSGMSSPCLLCICAPCIPQAACSGGDPLEVEWGHLWPLSFFIFQNNLYRFLLWYSFLHVCLHWILYYFILIYILDHYHRWPFRVILSLPFKL